MHSARVCREEACPARWIPATVSTGACQRPGAPEQSCRVCTCLRASLPLSAMLCVRVLIFCVHRTERCDDPRPARWIPATSLLAHTCQTTGPLSAPSALPLLFVAACPPPPPPPPPALMTLILRAPHPPTHLLQDAIRGFFADCGPVAEVRIAYDRETGRARGFAHIQVCAWGRASAFGGFSVVHSAWMAGFDHCARSRPPGPQARRLQPLTHPLTPTPSRPPARPPACSLRSWRAPPRLWR